MPEPIDVLVVEDDPYDVERIAREIAAEFPGSRVKWIAEGERALKFLNEEQYPDGEQGPPLPRLVLLDLDLPATDGLGLLRRLRAQSRSAPLPIVVLKNGAGPPVEPKEIYAAGANSLVVRPARHDEYVETLRGIVAYWLRKNDSPGK